MKRILHGRPREWRGMNESRVDASHRSRKERVVTHQWEGAVTGHRKAAVVAHMANIGSRNDKAMRQLVFRKSMEGSLFRSLFRINKHGGFR